MSTKNDLQTELDELIRKRKQTMSDQSREHEILRRLAELDPDGFVLISTNGQPSMHAVSDEFDVLLSRLRVRCRSNAKMLTAKILSLYGERLEVSVFFGSSAEFLYQSESIHEPEEWYYNVRAFATREDALAAYNDILEQR